MVRLKSQSPSTLRKKFAWLGKVYGNENIVWSPGYFVSSVGIDEKMVSSDVKLQGRQDSGQIQLQLKLWPSRISTLARRGIYQSGADCDMWYASLIFFMNTSQTVHADLSGQSSSGSRCELKGLLP